MTPYGPYQLVRRLAVGGMAEVFLAQRADPPADQADQRLVVKRILPHLEDKQQFVRMFLDEARLTAQLFHPNVVQIHDFGKADGVHYIAMEFVDGHSLRQLLRETPGEPLPLPLCCLVVSDACAALAYAHTKTGVGGDSLGIVHRDVSPDNILLSRAGEVKLADFGIAKASIHLSRTRPGQIKGKLAYMSPEQALRGQIDHRSDIFALGAVLFEVSTGRRLFDGPNDAHVLEALLRADYPDPRDLLPDFSPELAEVINRALQHRPADRYDDARAMRQALLELLPSRQTATAELSRRVVAAVARAESQRPRGRDGQRTEVAHVEGTVPGVGPGGAPSAPMAAEDEEENLLLVTPEEAETDRLRRPQPLSEVTRRYSADAALEIAHDADTIEEAPAVSLSDALDATATGETVPEARAINMSVHVAPSTELVVSSGEQERRDITGPSRQGRRRPTADIQATRPRQIIDEPLVGDDDDDRDTAPRTAISDDEPAQPARSAQPAQSTRSAQPAQPAQPAQQAAPSASLEASEASEASDEPAYYDVDHNTDVVDVHDHDLAPARVAPDRPLPYLWIGVGIALVAALITTIAMLI